LIGIERKISLMEFCMFPVILAKDLDKNYYAQKWQKQFVKPGRRRAEGIWRRTQDEVTRDKSGWSGSHDMRRRMIHFLDEYGMVENGSGSVDFAIVAAYLWMAVTLPSEECGIYEQRVRDALSANQWKEISENEYVKAELTLSITHHKQHPEDVEVGRKLPENYRTLEYQLATKGMTLDERVIDSPWNMLNSGIRKQGKRTDDPTIVNDVSVLKDHFPVQVELAGGASIELGIPPLNHLHTTYNVTNAQDKSFIFGDDDFLTDLIANPVAFYEKAGMAYKTCILSEPNEFYRLLRRLYDEGFAVGDVITNNFDGLPSLVGLKEKYIRRYDEPKHYPKIEFDNSARSLLVIGNHADRRRVQKQARERGMKVIYVDPEMYVDYFGNPVSYPLENVQKEDILFHKTAVEFATELEKLLITSGDALRASAHL
jgi:hypothetical protein